MESKAKSGQGSAAAGPGKLKVTGIPEAFKIVTVIESGGVKRLGSSVMTPVAVRGDFAVGRDEFARWSLTHIPSGTRVSVVIRNAADAKKVLRAFPESWPDLPDFLPEDLAGFLSAARANPQWGRSYQQLIGYLQAQGVQTA